jgi:transcriptional regulator with XRE-family HTH domain
MGTRTLLARVLFERCLTHAEVCELAGISRQTLSNAVNGRPVSTEIWIRLALGLGVPVSTIAPPEDAARILAVS